MKDFVEERVNFPDPALAGRDGLVMVGGALTAKSLLEAYSFGIFPWPQEGLPVLWFCPAKRGILDFADFHVARSFKKFLKETKFRLTWNQEFATVIQECAKAPRPGQQGTWITPEIERAYVELHQAGYAHSLECWDGDELVGGLYGTFVAGVFSGESMFYLKPNASKFCLWHLCEELKRQELKWMDTQMVTPHLKAWGGKYITRKEFLMRLEKSKMAWKTRRITLPT